MKWYVEQDGQIWEFINATTKEEAEFCAGVEFGEDAKITDCPKVRNTAYFAPWVISTTVKKLLEADYTIDQVRVMSAKERLKAVLEYEGILGYTELIITLVEEMEE